MRKTAKLAICLLFAACNSSKDAPAPSAKPAEPAPSVTPIAPAAAPAPAPLGAAAAGMNLAVTAPRTADTITVPGAEIEAKEAVDTAAFKKDLQENGLGTFDGEEKLADGWVVRYKDSEGVVQSAVQRALGGRTYLCTAKGDKQADIDNGKKVCLAMAADANGVVVPFALPSDERALVSVGDVSLEVETAEADSPKTAEEAFTLKKTGKIVKSEAFAGGYSMIGEGQNGDIAGQGPITVAKVREKVGSLDLSCAAWGSTKSVEHAQKVVAACRSLRAP